jgi:hypothetical protein
MWNGLNEPVDALVIYRRGAPHPLLRAFRWKQRRYDVTTTHLVHREREGEVIHRIYSVSCGRETYVLRLDADRAQWTLEAVEASD